MTKVNKRINLFTQLPDDFLTLEVCTLVSSLVIIINKSLFFSNSRMAKAIELKFGLLSGNHDYTDPGYASVTSYNYVKN